MNRYRLGLCLIATVVYIFLSIFFGTESFSAVHEKSPTVAFEKLTHHFGDLFQHEEHSYSFRFKNVGAQPLKILSVEGT